MSDISLVGLKEPYIGCGFRWAFNRLYEGGLK